MILRLPELSTLLVRIIRDPSLLTTLEGLGSLIAPLIIFGLAFIFHSGKYASWESLISWGVIIFISFMSPESVAAVVIVLLLFEMQKRQLEANATLTSAPPESGTPAK